MRATDLTTDVAVFVVAEGLDILGVDDVFSVVAYHDHLDHAGWHDLVCFKI